MEIDIDVNAVLAQPIGWAIMRLTGLEISATVSPKNYESRKVTATYEMPESMPLRIAIPLSEVEEENDPPENTVPLSAVRTMSKLILQELENAIEDSLESNQQGE
jgi:hypothetical protein